jgi:hypothetical protein
MMTTVHSMNEQRRAVFLDIDQSMYLDDGCLLSCAVRALGCI